MEYRSIADLNGAIFFNAHKIPTDIDLVVGIPRSGLLAANLLALQLNLPLLDLDGLIEGRRPKVGRTVRETMKSDPDAPPRRVLIVDDSIASGESMLAVRQRVASERPDLEVLYCAVYGLDEKHPEVDLVLETVPAPRVFQWNLMRHKYLDDACFDIDGVLCHDPESTDNDDGEAYTRFLLSARPLLRPNARIKHLVTSRLEKYRPQTEAWLAQHGVQYEKLWMLDLPSAEERRRLKAHAPFKSKVYVETGAAIFVESEDDQAQEIATLSGRPVLSIEGQRIVWPEGSESVQRRYARNFRKARNARRSLPARLITSVFGDRGLTALKRALGR